MPTCPKCGSTNSIPIVYGKPSNEGLEKARRGEIVLGGCIITPNCPKHQCKECGNRYR